MEGRGEAERQAWEAQVDEAVAVVSVAGEEAAALLARRRRRRGRGTEVEEDRGDSGEGGEKSEARDDDDEEEEEEDGGGGFFDSVDVGDESRVSALREAGFEKAGPLQLRLLIEVDVPESSGGAEGGGGGERIKLTVGGGGAAASVSSLQPLRLAASLPRRYLMPPSLAPSSSSPSSTTAAAAAEEEGEEGEEERIPSVAVSAPWLSAPAAARLEARLRSLARGRLLPLLPLSGEEPPPVVFELVELARDSALAEALSAAGGDGGGSLDLLEVVGGNEEDGKHRGDPAADADAAAAALALLRQLVSDDAAQQRERFLRGTHACPICLEGGVPGSRATALPCCGVAGRRRPRPGPGSEPPTPAPAGSGGGPRAACTACLAALASSALLSRDASALLCPFPDCREPLSPALLSSLLPPERAELAEALRLERALAQMGALRCPHCDFAAVVGDAQGCCLCPSCRHSFCATCFDSWHGSARECSSAEARLALARARRARAERERGPDGSGSGSGGANDRASALALRRAEEEFLSLAAIARSGSKPCPACRTPIERSAGCNRMRCAACSTSFCFVCSAVISEEEGYAHFGSGRCRLLSAEEIARWEREERGPEAAAADRNAFWLGLARRQQGQRQRGGGGEGGEGGNNPHNVLSRRIKVSRCPTCGAQHAGESNDRRCGSCKTRHCGSCGEVLRRGVVHFGRPPKCPAHF